MIQYVSVPGSPVVEITVGGKITDPELRDAMERMKADLGEGKTRVLERIEHFSGIDPAALWTDIRLGVPLAQKITKAAIVADAAWIRSLTDLAKVLTKAEVKTFRPDQIEEARSWVSAD